MMRFQGIKANHRLKLILLKQGMTQRELAKQSGVTESYISLYVRGRMNLSTDQKTRIAEALSMPLNRVFA